MFRCTRLRRLGASSFLACLLYALVARVTAALGVSPADWEAAIEGWTQRIKDDIVIATMYGQLFAQVETLPMKGSPPNASAQ